MKASKQLLSRYVIIFSLCFSVYLPSASGAVGDAGLSVYMMPLNCGELLPESANFISFFEAVAKGVAASDKALSRRLLRINSLREKTAEIADLSRNPNPVDTLIQKTICFYRSQKEPLKPIPFDDSDFIHFLKTSLKDLESKVDDAVFQVQFEKYQRDEYSRRVFQNRVTIEKLEREAGQDASRDFQRLSETAKKKARAND